MLSTSFVSYSRIYLPSGFCFLSTSSSNSNSIWRYHTVANNKEDEWLLRNPHTVVRTPTYTHTYTPQWRNLAQDTQLLKSRRIQFSTSSRKVEQQFKKYFCNVDEPRCIYTPKSLFDVDSPSNAEESNLIFPIRSRSKQDGT